MLARRMCGWKRIVAVVVGFWDWGFDLVLTAVGLVLGKERGDSVPCLMAVKARFGWV